MGIFLCKIRKSYSGESWENVYGIETYPTTGFPFFADQTPSLSDADVNALIDNGANPLDQARTDPTNALYGGEGFPLHALLGFERLLHWGGVSFDNLLLTNGSEGDDAAISFALNFFGLASFGAGGDVDVAPGNVALNYVKTTAQVAYRNGRGFLRGALGDNEVEFSGFRLVALTNPAATQARFEGALADAYLTNWLANGSGIAASSGGLAARVGVPRYSPRNPSNPLAGSLVGMSRWSTVGTVKATGRQVQRGRRRQ